MLYPTTLVDDAMNTVAGTPVFRHPSDGADPAPQGLCLPMRGPSRGRCQICNYIGSGLPLLEGLVRKPSLWILLSSATLLWVDEGPACWRGSTGVARRRRFPDSCPSEVWSSLMGRSSAKTSGVVCVAACIIQMILAIGLSWSLWERIVSHGFQ